MQERAENLIFCSFFGIIYIVKEKEKNMYGYIDGYDFGEILYVHCADW